MKPFDTTIDVPFADAEMTVRAALKEQGFGVLTEIDVAATFKEKLNVDRPALKILGACNPNFAYRALMIDPAASLLLPCNVVLETVAGGTYVAIADPRELMPGAEFVDLVDEAARQLIAVITAIEKV
jgi:uncharacterized protein (DUF302 family)